MAGYVDDIEKLARENEYFRRVIYTAPHSQLVLMSLKPGEDIGEEVHKDTDQFLRIEVGEGESVLAKESKPLKGGSVVVVPSGVPHNIVNTSKKNTLKLYTIYSPPHHRDGVIHTTKEEALADNEHFDGKISK